jgi:hypothetical protein
MARNRLGMWSRSGVFEPPRRSAVSPRLVSRGESSLGGFGSGPGSPASGVDQGPGGGSGGGTLSAPPGLGTPAGGGAGTGPGAPGAWRGWPWLTSDAPPSPICRGLSAPPAAGTKPGGGGGSMPMARIRARCVAAWVLAQGKSGLDAKYWTSSCMYRPDGNVMPAYSTWHPTEGRITPMASADHCATRRLVDPRGDLLRGNPIVSTLLGVFGGPSEPSFEGGLTAVGESIPGPARPSPPRQPGPFPRTRAERVVGFITWLSNRPNSPSRTNDSAHFEENSIASSAECSG